MAAVPGILRRWNPGIIPGLQFWVDPTDNSTISSNANSTVNSIVDKSANRVLMAQPTSANQPTMAIGLSGKPVIQFAQNLYLQTNNFPATFSNSRPISQISVFTYNNNNNSSPNYFTELIGASTTNNFTIRITAVDYLYVDVPGIAIVDPQSITNPIFIEGFYNSNRTGYGYQVNSNLINVDDSSSYIFSDTSSVAQYTNRLSNFIIGGTNTTKLFNGTMCEVVLYDRFHFETLYMRQLEGYLAWKWGMIDRLSNAHPYKNRPPS